MEAFIMPSEPGAEAEELAQTGVEDVCKLFNNENELVRHRPFPVGTVFVRSILT